jgi:allophanate hydrolase
MSSASPTSLRNDLSLDLGTLAHAYEAGSLTPLDVIDCVYARLTSTAHDGVFIHEVSYADARAAAEDVIARKQRGERMRLYGVPFAVKDNIDVADMPTTAACPAFEYRARASASVVLRLIAEGAIVIGKTNLDQFATGLVGVRSPYGIPENPFDAKVVPGGSSSGSAVAVSRGFCSFALGTDTAGSGRVPAAFNNLVGLKPTRGMLSTHGVVPACRSLDCVSVFALTVDDASEIAHACAGFDAADPYARNEADAWDPHPALPPSSFRFAVPMDAQLALDDEGSRSLFASALQAAAAVGGKATPLDFSVFAATAALLYDGPFVAERLEASAALFERDPDALHPVIREILISAKRFSALDASRGYAELARLRRLADGLLRDIDCLIVPSAPLLPHVDDVLDDPLRINSRLGTYTNFVNLLDMCALAIPAGFRADGLPFGITLIAKRGRDAWLSSLGKALHEARSTTLGALGHALPTTAAHTRLSEDTALLAVVGAHLAGEPLNHQLLDLGAKLVSLTRTRDCYRLFALPTQPAKPGLVRANEGEAGHAIEVEVYALSHAALWEFMRLVNAPLCIGRVELADGSLVHGFLCEPSAAQGQREISAFGGWRTFRRARA